jgi:flagellin-like hook-associated protein FlgL
MADVSLSKAVRSNLLSLQSTAASMAKTQERLATGLKVNSALDNPTNFFTAAALTSRSGDMANLLDSMSSGIKTIEAADNGLTSITKTVETMQSTLRQARQDKSFKTESYAMNLGTGAALDGQEQITFTGGAFGVSTGTTNLTTSQTQVTGGAYTAMDFDNAGAYGANLSFNVTANGGAARAIQVSATNATTLSITVDGGSATTFTVGDTDAVTNDELSNALNAAFSAAGNNVGVTVSHAAGATGALTFTSNAVSSEKSALTITGIAASATPVLTASFGMGAPTTTLTNTTAKSVDTLVTEINNNTALNTKLRASNDNGKLRIENQSTSEMTVGGVTAAGELDGESGTGKILGNDVRKNLVKQFNELRDQLDKFADDASFNGINLLRGDKLKLTFNETGTSTIEIQAKDEGGVPTSINNTALGIDEVFNADFDNDVTLDDKLNTLSDVMGKLRSHSSSFGSNLSIVENRTDFTKKMINTLETGASNLTLADTNEEAANLLALQTRQQLSSTALSMASQADQAVLRLFG